MYLFYFLFFYFAVTVFYLFSLAVAGRLLSGRLAKRMPPPASFGTQRIAILVPAYKEDGIIVSTARSHLELDFPKELFDVYILADSFQDSTLEQLAALPVEVLVMSFEKSTKVRS